MTEVRTRRVHDHLDDPEGTQGYVVLVDRFWPRGVRKERLRHDLWAKNVAPSTALRQWFHAAAEEDRSALFEEFAERYRVELAGESAGALDELVDHLRGNDVVTLLFGARDVAHNHAQVLAGVLAPRLA